MLSALSVRNVVLIDKLDLNFKTGLSVFTGETGAGKSVLLDSLSLALGARADAGLVRYGTDKLSVCAEFILPPSHQIFERLKENDIDFSQNDPLILRRSVDKDGKSKAFVNDQPVSVSFLKLLGEELVEIHGQFSTHSLLNPATHLNVLDTYGELATEKKKTKEAFLALKESDRLLKEALFALEKAQKDEEYLRFATNELDRLSPQKGEEEALSSERAALMNAEKITEALNEAYQILNQNQEGNTSLSKAMRALERADRLTEGGFQDALQCLEKIDEELGEVTSLLEEKGASYDDPSARLEELEERLFALKDMARKYRCLPDDLPDKLQEFQKQLACLSKGEEEVFSLRQTQEKNRLSYLKQAKILSALRQKAAEKLDKAVMKELPDLKLEKAVFKTKLTVKEEEKWSENGLDDAVFEVSTNMGTPLSALNKIASGGELARFMLALKVNTALNENLEIMVFDEIDTGMSGPTARAIGQRLKKLAQKTQVLVITHSPQVASCGTDHFIVAKKEDKTGIQTFVHSLTEEERIREIARMLSGREITPTALQNAKELLEEKE
jgi:DNA repair protein RecN (Recombination protein N)